VRRAAADPADGVYAPTRAPEDCPDEAAAVEIAFVRGVPASINNVEMPILDLISSLGTIAGAHGVGRLELPANPAAVRTFCEAPAGVVLHAAHRALQRRVSSGGAERVALLVASEYAALVTSGLWFTPLRGALDAFVNAIQEDVTGVVRVTLFKGGLGIE
jgi:argininosuccinate synthase